MIDPPVVVLSKLPLAMFEMAKEVEVALVATSEVMKELVVVAFVVVALTEKRLGMSALSE